MLKNLALVVITIAGGLGLSSCSATAPPTPEPISIGFTVADTTVLLLIAEDQQFFAANGLNATLKPYDTALAALAGMNQGEVDVAENAEFPIIAEAFRKNNISILASVDRFDIVSLATRKDKGIQNIADLKGKRIGVPKGAVAEFYVGRFLDLNGLDLNEVTIVNLPFQAAVDALPGGTADAFAVRFKDISLVNERLGGNVSIWPCQNGQMGYDVLSARNQWLANHAEAAKKLIKTMEQAESYMASNPAEARAIIQKRLKYGEAQMKALDTQNAYSVTLDRSLIAAMEDEARWMIKNNLTTEKTIPDMGKYIYKDALKTVKPEAVNIN